MRHRKLAFIDLETTGLIAGKHEIIEIGCVLVDQATMQEIESFELKIKPQHIETADPQSLIINKYRESDWVFAVDLKAGLEHFTKKINGAIIVAHNLFFDWGFIERALQECGIPEPDHRKLDLFSIAWAKLHKESWAERFSLRALCEYLGIDNPRAHTALSDSQTAFLIYKKLMEK